MVARSGAATPIYRPDFLMGRCSSKRYLRWLNRKAAALARRDRRRRDREARIAEYRIEIHEAVLRSRGCDAYTGLPLRWDQISLYDNDASRRGGRAYKRKFGNIPTVDHTGDNRNKPRFKICAWRVNDAKSDLTLKEFLELCRQVLAFAGPD